MSVSVAVVIPTRNRPDLATSAIRSLKEQRIEIDIFVCDNSKHDEPLRSICRVEEVHYLRPPHPFSMGENWDWGLRQAMAHSSATHFTVHYDRKVSTNLWDVIAALAARHPDTVHSFSVDHISHFPPPLRLWQTPWTGRRFGIAASHVCALLSTHPLAAFSHALPLLSNCLVPRGILERIVGRFGDICNRTGPDSAFMARLFALEDGYIHVDRPQGILQGSARSNGLGYLRNKGGDFADFVSMSAADGDWLEAGPVPGLNLGGNMLYHEYELVRRATGERLPELDRAALVEFLGAELRWISPRRQSLPRQMLAAAGWSGTEPEPIPKYTRVMKRAQRQKERAMSRDGVRPPTITGFSFGNDASALEAALRHPRARQSDAAHLALLQGKDLDDEDG